MLEDTGSDIMDSGLHTFLSNPKEILYRCFDNYKSRCDGCLDYWNFGAENVFESLILKHYGQIPAYDYSNVRKIVNGGMARVRGFVQEIFDPEYFNISYESIDPETKEKVFFTSKYLETIDISFNESYPPKIYERTPINCISIPGEHSWSLKKSGCLSSIKENDFGFDPSIPTKFNKVKNSSAKCSVKVYYPEGLKMNRIVDFVGIFEYDTCPSSDHEQQHDFSVLHCIYWKDLNEANPLAPELEISPNLYLPRLLSIRSGIMDWISDMLGDSLMAEYLLFSLISHVLHRENDQVIGIIPLNIFNINPSRSEDILMRVQFIIRNLMLRSLTLSLSRKNLSESCLVPKKDSETGKLETGQLQLAPATCLILNEMDLDEGPLSSHAQENLKFLEKVINQQKVAYNLDIYEIDFQVDSPVFILSEAPSIFSVENKIPYIKSPKNPSSWNLLPIIRDWRIAIEIFRNSQVNKLQDDIRERIQDDFVNIRADENSPFELNETIYGNWITLTRLAAITFGEKEITLERYEYIKKMERRRQERIKTYKKSK